MITTILDTKKTLKSAGIITAFLCLPFFAQAQTGPAGIGSSSDNVLWLRADQGTSTTTNGSPISSWNDISGNANHSAQGNGGFQPVYILSGINGLPTIRFDGSDDYLIVPDADNLDNTNGVTVIVVAQPNSIDANPRGIVSKRVSSGNETAYSLFTFTGSNLYFDSPDRINGTTAVTNNPQILTGVYDGSVTNPRARVFQDGVQTGSGNTDPSIGNMASNLHVGILNAGYGQGFRGDISEVIVYRDNLNLAQRLIVETYLDNRYNIGITPTSYSSTTHTQDFTGIGHSGGDKYSDTQSLGSGIVLSERNGSLDEANEFVFTGHDGTAHGTNSSDLPTIAGVNLDERWDRIYYIERIQGGTVDAGTTDIRITFDFTEASLSLSTDRVYYLLYRAGTSGTFSEVPGGTGSASEGKVSINVSSANFASGYYTIVRSDQTVKTWYSLNDGDWDDFNTWSLKSTEPDNDNDEIPGIMDRAVILNNHTVTVALDNTQCGILDVIDGIVDFGTTTGNTFSTITGQANGKIRLAADNFPSGDASGFADASTGGTVEYYGTGYDLSTSRTYRNMIVNLTNTTDQLVLLSNYTLNGSLTVSRGEFHFGNASTTARSLTVYENVEVEASGKIRTGSGVTRHQFNLYGDFTNYGDVQFTTRAAANYTVDNADGIVDVNFLSATRDQNMQLEGPTRFYRIAIEKGISNTYELYMEATNAANFELFGYANEGHPDNSQLSVNNNSLGLAYGTVRIGPNITIPQLNGSGNYNVSENAILWVDGGTVTKPSGTAVVVYGKVKVSDGTFNAQINSGITTRLNGVFESSGGTTNLGQFRTSIFGTQHIGGYIQTGGYVTINQAWGSSANYYLFTLSYEGNVFTLTGGTLHIIGTNAKGSIFINSDAVNQNVSATATAILEATSATSFRITSKAPLPTVTMNRSGSGTRTFVLEGGIVGTDVSNQAELTALPLITKGTLTLSDNVIFDPKGQDVTIGRSYSIGSGASYIAGSNTTTFNGATQNYTLFINAGATTKYFHNLTINNSGYTGTLSTSDITVGNDLTITAGTLGTGAQTITVRGDISNSGTITSTTGKILITNRGIVNQVTVTNGGSYTSVPTVTIAAPGAGTQATAVAIFNGTPTVTNPLPIASIAITNTGSGYTAVPAVSFSGGAATATASISTTHELGGDGNGVFGNLELDEVHPSEAAGKVEVTFLAAKQTISGQLTLTNGIIDIKSYNFILEGTLSSDNEADYSETILIRTLGNHSDGGLTRKISTDGTYLFPLGTYKVTSSTNRFAWAKPTLSSIVDDGYLQINGVPQKLPTLAFSTPDRYLAYYWRIRSNGFTSTPSIQNQFLSYEGDYTWTGNFNNYLIGKVIGYNRYSDGGGAANLGSLDNPSAGKRLLNYSVIKPLEIGEFTSAFGPYFNGSVRVFYLYRNNQSWNTVNTWSTTRGVDVNTYGDYPRAGDIAVIRRTTPGVYSGIVNVTNAEAAAQVTFDAEGAWSSGCPRIVFTNDLSFNSNFEIVNIADTHEGGIDGINDGERHGAVIQYNLSATYAGQFPNGDFGDFYQYDNALIIYQQSGAAGTRNLSKYGTEYPQLWFQTANSTYILPDTNVTVNGRVILPYNIQVHINSGTYGNLLVKKRFDIGHANSGYGSGQLVFPGTATSDKTVTVLGAINLLRHSSTGTASHIRINGATGGGRKHKIIAHSNITLMDNCHINLGDGDPANTNVELILTGEDNASLTATGTATVTTPYIFVDKGTTQATTFSFDWPFTLNGPTDGTTEEKALQLQNGTLYLNNSGIDIDLSTGGEDFYIPSTAGLVVQAGEVNVSGDDNGILLDGLLRVETGGVIDMDDAVGNGNNYIEYSASGNATIEVTGGALTVGSQVRRGTSNSSGVLKYTQTGGTVIVGKNAAPVTNRGTFEILNSGSRFIYTSGSLTVVRPQSGSPTVASVLLEPAVGSAGNTTIQLGNGDTPAASVITLKSLLELGNLTIGGASTTAQLKDRSLTVKRDLTIGTGCSFDGTGLFNLTVNRHIINNGAANFNVDTLYLMGNSTSPSEAMQNITGSVRVNNLVVEPETSVTLQAASGLEIDEDMFLNSGQLTDGGNEILVKGNVTNNASHASSNPAAGGIVFGGTSLQRIYGTGQFGRIEVDNTNGVQLENSISMEDDLTLTNGIFQLQSNKLTLGLDADIVGSGFDNTKMIAVGGGDFLQGIQKTFPVVATAVPTDPYDETDPAFTYEFTFPIGVDNGTERKYTPVEFYIASNDTQGSVNLYPVNRKHITFDATQTDVLQYYWIMNSSGLTDFTSLMHTHYLNADVVGDESAYIGAKLYDNFWAKYEEDAGPPVIEVVYEADDYVAYITDGVNLITGEYTAGIEPHIPDQVPLFYTKQDGDWTDANTWEREDGGVVPAGGPVGQRVHIRTAHTVTVTSNYRRAYRTTINGRLELGTTINHILGYVSGTGTLSSETSSLPAGDYTDFFACGTGSTMEWAGGTYGLPSSIEQYNNLTITGTGTKTFPNKDMTICGDLRIENSVTLKQPGAASGYLYTTIEGDVYLLNTATWDMSNRTWIRLRGDFNKDNTARFNAQYSVTYAQFDGTDDQTINGIFTGINNFRYLQIENPGIVTLNGPVDMAIYLYILNNSRIQTTNVNLLKTIFTSALRSPVNGLVEGPVSIRMNNTTLNKFLPVGKNNVKKYISILDLPTTGDYWIGEYFNTSAGGAGMNPLSLDDPPLKTISQSEYWQLTGPAGHASHIQLTLNGTSDVAAGIGNKDDLRIVYWDGAEWVMLGTGASVTDALNGTITSTGSLGTFTFTGAEQFFTIGAVQPVEIVTATITSVNESICESDSYNLDITIVGNNPPFELDYSIGAANFTESGINTLDHTITLSVPVGVNTITLTAIRDSDTPVNTGNIIGTTNVTVTVYADHPNPPSDPYPIVTSGGNICGATTTTVELDGSVVGFTYELFRDGIYFSSLVGTGGALSFTGIDQAGTYTVEAYNTSFNSCTAIMDGDAEIEFGSAATAEVTSLLSAATICEGEGVEIEITFTGTPPFTFTVEDNDGGVWADIVVDVGDLVGAGPYTYNFTIPDQLPTWTAPDLPNIFNYNVTAITDAAGCGAGTVVGTGVDVNVYKIPETGPQYHIPNTFGE